MRYLVIVSRDDHGVAHDGSAGVSPEGWLPDRVSVGALTRAFPPELVDRVVDTTDTRELRRRLLPARLVVYFVLALWLFRGPNCGYGRVMVKLVDALYHRRRGQAAARGGARPGRLGRGRGGSAVAAAEHLQPVPRPDQVGGRPAAHAVRPGRRAGRRRRRGGGVLLRAAGGVGGWLQHRRAQFAGQRRVLRPARQRDRVASTSRARAWDRKFRSANTSMPGPNAGSRSKARVCSPTV